MPASSEYPCAACGFLVFGEPPGSYDICPVCGWEDDHVQLRFPGSDVGANHVSLYNWQRQYALRKAPQNLDVHSGFRRASGWRPLRPEEASTHDTEPLTGRAYFDATSTDAPSYYWESSGERAI